MTGPAPLELHSDRLLPPEPEVRAIARRLYEAVRAAPIVPPHGHVDPRLLLDDDAFPDPRRCWSPSSPLVLGAWVAHLRGAGTAVVDVRADEVVPLANR
jgi:hypothetical protein